MLHYNDKLYFLLDSRAKDNATWASEPFMVDGHLHISGPRYAKESGLIWYMQQHAMLENTGGDGHHHDHDPFGLETSLPGFHFKGYSVVMLPLGDLSYIDLLPQRG